MARYRFKIHGTDLVEYTVGRKKMFFKYDLTTPVLYIQFKLFDHWEPPHNAQVRKKVQAKIADRFYDFIIKQGKDERKVVIYDKL